MIVSVLLLICAQMFALGHLHVGADDSALPDCTQCALAKVPLTPAADAAPTRLPLIPNVRLPLPATAELPMTSSRFHVRAREPPPA
jgi:hypothetical protein